MIFPHLAQARLDFNMIEAHQEPRPQIRKLIQATAAMVHENKLSPDNFGQVAHYITLKDRGYCRDFPLANQYSLSECSGTLISERHILTAGHCADLKNMCRRYKWIFDYQMNKFGKTPSGFLDHQVYNCKKVTASVNVQADIGLIGDLYKTFFRTDFAIIELDRPVIDREPVKLASEDKVSSGTKVFSISYPLGTPAKISQQGEVIEGMNTSSYFWSSLTVFPGSSGGAVFDEESLEVVGVISKGIPTTERDKEQQCFYERLPDESVTSGSVNSNAQMKMILEVVEQKKISIR